MKKVLIMLCALCMGFAYADNVPANKIVSSKEYVDDQLADKQTIFGANANNVAVFTAAAGTIIPKPVTETLTGNGVSNTDLPTVGAVNSGLDTKQDKIGVSNVPNEYTQLEYIEITGTQSIDTGIIFDPSVGYRIVFQPTSTNKFVTSTSNGRGQLIAQNTGKWECRTLSTTLQTNQPVDTSTFATLTYNIDNACSVDGVQTSFSGQNLNDGGRILVPGTSYPATGYIKSIQIYSSNTPVRDFIPARRNRDNVLGMYDTVTGTFFINAGAGTFIAGPAVATIGAPGTVVTYTDTPGELGVKGIYQDSGTYAEQQNALVDAGTFNAALQNGLDNEFVCANRLDAYDPVTGNCWLWTIHNETILPSGYTPLEYIQSTGTQYVDTGIIFDSSVGYRIVFQPTSTNKFVTSTSNGRGQLIAQNTGKWECRTLSTTLQTNQPVDTSTFATLTYNIDNACSVDGVQTSFSGQNLNDGGRILVPGTSHPATGYIKSIQIYSNNTPVRDFIPARRNSDGVVGMYDTVTGTFFTNAGTGTFFAGPVAPNNYLPQNQ